MDDLNDDDLNDDDLNDDDLNDQGKCWGECWACIEYNNNWSIKTVVMYCMAGNMCEKHKDDDGIEQITDPISIGMVEVLINLNNRQN